jgi:ribosomal protein L40E
MQCPECQSDNPADARFCNKCGSKLEIACPQCNKANPPGSNFCNECGHNLSKRDVPRENADSPDYAGADLLFQKSIDADETSGAVVLAARTKYYRADLLARQGEIEASRSLLAEIQRQFQHWGMPAWQLKCDKALQTIM